MPDFNFPDIDRLLSDSHEQIRRVESMQQHIAELTGSGEAADGLVMATATSADGLTAIAINPRAMRLDSELLSDAVLAAARGALEDLQRKTFEGMRDVIGDDLMDLVTGTADPQQFARGLEDSFKVSADDAMTKLDDARRRAGY